MVWISTTVDNYRYRLVRLSWTVNVVWMSDILLPFVGLFLDLLFALFYRTPCGLRAPDFR